MSVISCKLESGAPVRKASGRHEHLSNAPLHLRPEALHHALAERVHVPPEADPHLAREGVPEEQHPPGALPRARGEGVQRDAGCVRRVGVRAVEVAQQGQTYERRRRLLRRGRDSSRGRG